KKAADGPTALRVVGKALRKVDATAKVLGVTKFADDLSLPRMLYCKLLRSPHPHARIVRIDATRALALPGVKVVLTGKDLPIPFGRSFPVSTARGASKAAGKSPETSASAGPSSSSSPGPSR